MEPEVGDPDGVRQNENNYGDGKGFDEGSRERGAFLPTSERVLDGTEYALCAAMTQFALRLIKSHFMSLKMSPLSKAPSHGRILS